jgi:hypothetical protein
MRLQPNESDSLEYESPPAGLDPKGWMHIRLRPGQTYRNFPPVCSRCLGPTSNFVPISALLPIRLHYPLCEACQRGSGRRSATVLALAFLVVCAAALGVWYAMGRVSGWTGAHRISTAAMVLTLGIALSIVLVQNLTGPVKHGRWIRGQDWVKVKFRNFEFAKLAANQYRPRE